MCTPEMGLREFPTSGCIANRTPGASLKVQAKFVPPRIQAQVLSPRGMTWSQPLVSTWQMFQQRQQHASVSQAIILKKPILTSKAAMAPLSAAVLEKLVNLVTEQVFQVDIIY